MMMPTVVFIAVFAIFIIATAIRILNEYERGVVFRMGRVTEPKGPGMVLVIPLMDKLQRVDMRTITHDVPGQDIITKDNVSVRVSAVVYFRVIDAVKASVEIENYKAATSQLAQTTLRSVCGQEDLDHILSERDAKNKKMQEILDHETEPWGVAISKVELKEIDLPESMQRAMAKQAEAERERRATVINADGELQAAAKLSEAAELIAKEPVTLQLRYLQTIREIGVSEQNTTLMPVPIELFKHFFKSAP